MEYTFELTVVDEYDIYKNGKLYTKGNLPLITEVIRHIEFTLKMQAWSIMVNERVKWTIVCISIVLIGVLVGVIL